MSATSRHIFLAILLLASAGSLFAFGIWGIGRGGGEGNFDGAVLYGAGLTWLHGGNPYDPDELAGSVAHIVNLKDIPFFYPPQSAGLCIPLALLPYPIAKGVWLAVNLLSIVALAVLTGWTLRKRIPGVGGETGAWVLTAIVIGNPFTTHVVWMGQTSLLAVAATVAAWVFQRERRWLAAGLCLGLASFKPQLCVLVGIWFLLERDWKTLGVALLTALVMSGYLMGTQGPVTMLQAWVDGVRHVYGSLEANAPTFQHKIGLESLLGAAGLPVPGKALTATGFLLAAVLWVFRKRIDTEDALGLLMALTFTFVGYSHDYDYVGLVPLLASLWVHAWNRRGLCLVVGPLVLLLFMPQRLVRDLNSPVLNHWRAIVVVLMMVITLAVSIRKSEPEASATGDGPRR